MSVHTRQSLTGFIASDPELSRTVTGDARLYLRIGQPHYQRNDDGTSTRLETTFHSLVLYGRAAERAHDQFRKGDRFVADGHLREYTYELDGEQKTTAQFLASTIGHDTARTTYTVDRPPSAGKSADCEPGKGSAVASTSCLDSTGENETGRDDERPRRDTGQADHGESA